MIESKKVSMSRSPCKCRSRSPSLTTDTTDNNEETSCRNVMVIFDSVPSQGLRKVLKQLVQTSSKV